MPIKDGGVLMFRGGAFFMKPKSREGVDGTFCAEPRECERFGLFDELFAP